MPKFTIYITDADLAWLREHPEVNRARLFHSAIHDCRRKKGESVPVDEREAKALRK